MQIILGLLIPFIGTTIGSAMVFLMKNKINRKVEKFLLGFASGVMIAASVWSLLMPSIEMAKEQGTIEWIPASIGFVIGIVFLLWIDYITTKMKEKKEEVKQSSCKKKSRLFLAVTLHNIPEGMAVGVALAGAMFGNTGITISAALALAIGIGIQNFPEGAIISMPLKNEGMGKLKAFGYGILSAVVEPIASIITILLTKLVVPILPYFLSFAAGAMIYVVVEELVPETQQGKHSEIGTIGVSIGFIIMMILDVALG